MIEFGIKVSSGAKCYFCGRGKKDIEDIFRNGTTIDVIYIYIYGDYNLKNVWLYGFSRIVRNRYTFLEKPNKDLYIKNMRKLTFPIVLLHEVYL